jgi:Ca2+/H+ antiporter
VFSAFFIGGYKHKTQRFNKISSQINGCLLLLAVSATLFTTLMNKFGQFSKKGELAMSRLSSLVLFLLYLAFLWFQMFTHKDAYDKKEDTVDSVNICRTDSTRYRRVDLECVLIEDASHQAESENSTDVRRSHPLDSPTANSNPLNKTLNDSNDAASGGGGRQDEEEEVEEEEEEEDVLGVTFGIFWLGVVTVFIAFLSDALVYSIEQVANNSKSVSGVFLASIVVPIVGNAAEHASAVIFAIKNKLDISLGVAVGSSTQIALMVLPLVVIIGWIVDRPMDLNLHPFEAFSLFLTVMISMLAIKDGTSNWLVGAILIGCYVIIAIAFACMKDESLGGYE